MKKLIFLLFLLIFASTASATVYRWVDQGGTVTCLLAEALLEGFMVVVVLELEAP